MKLTSLSLAVLLLGVVLTLAAPARADLNSDLAFSAFHDVDLNALAGGQILQARGPIMAFPRGITSQSLFIINAQPADVAKRLTTWNPASHADLKVWLHKSLPQPPKPEDFAALATLPDNSSVQFQIDATAKWNADKPALQVSKAEAQLIAATVAQGGEPRQIFAKAWGQILAGRVNEFLAGRGGSLYDVGPEGDVHPLNDAKQLLHSDPRVYGQYQGLLNQTPAKALANTAAGHINPSDLYCDVFDVQGYAAVGTGAIYQAAKGNSIQSADIEYFTNYGVYTTVELEEMWPVTVNGRTVTLVWREDLVSAPNVEYLHGTERLASSMIMLQETKGGVEAFRAEFQ